MRPSTPFFSALLLLASCSTVPGPVLPAAAPSPAEAARTALSQEVKAVSAKAEALLRAQDELVWKSWTEGTPADLAKTYAGTEAWMTPAAIASVERLRQMTPDAPEQRALSHLHAYLVTEWLAQETSAISEEEAKLVQTATFGQPGQEHPYRNLESLLASERSALLRKTLYEGATPVVVRLAETLARRRARTEALLGELGISSSALIVELRETELDPLVALADEVLTRTQSAFSATVGRLAVTELQLPLERVSRADIPRLFRLPAEDAAFPKADIYGRAARTLQGLGIDLSTMKNVTVDLKETPGKNPRGLVLGVVIPSDVRVSLLPVGGGRDERETLFHMGQVLSDGLSQERRWALAQLGNGTVGEAWSFLMEDLAVDPVWLERVGGLPSGAQAAWRTSVSAQRLFLLRRAAAKVLFNARARTPGADVPALYREVMARTYGFSMTKADEARAELEREEFLAAADHLQAFILEAQLEQQLRGRFGPAWWEKRAAGDWMRGLLGPGNSVPASGLVRALGEDHLDVEAFLAKLPTAVGWTPPRAPPPLPSPVDAGTPAAAPVDAAGQRPFPDQDDGGGPHVANDAGLSSSPRGAGRP